MDEVTDQALERLAGAVMMASVCDPDSLAGLSSLLAAVEPAVGDSETLLRPLYDRCRAALGAIDAADPGTLDAFSEAVLALQEAAYGGGRSAAADPSALTLPDWIEESVFNEFITDQAFVLDEIEADLMALEGGGPDLLAGLRRKLHTLKGESGVLGLKDLETVCHRLEDAMADESAAGGRVDAFLAALDWIRNAIEAYRLRHHPEGDCASVLGMLHEAPAADPATVPADQTLKPAPVPSPSTASRDDGPEPWDEETLEVVEEFLTESEEGLAQVDEILLSIEQKGPDLEKVNAIFRVFHTIKGVAGFLELTETTTLAHATETLLNRAREEEIVIDRGVLDLLFEATSHMRAMIDRIASAAKLGAKPARTHEAETLVAQLYAASRDEAVEVAPAADPEAVEETDAAAADDIDEPASTAAPAVDGPKPVAVPAGKPPARAAARSAPKEKKLKEVVRVDVERVESLVGLIGELVIVESMINNSSEIGVASPALREHLSQMYKITRDLQDIATRMRMVPVKAVFQKMARMVRDVSRGRGKAVRAVLEGENTEMDRHMVEQISDPLVHMIRNAIDHGIEDAAGRQAAGKPAEGTVHLRAYHQGGSVVVEVCDDGRGLDREAILRKAIEKGIVTDSDKLSDADIYSLIFAPGFSTAKQITEISGRGVGMDVVRRNIEGMRGTVRLNSTPGQGSTVTILLPLTLAIIDGMLIVCGSERYIIPSLSVIELVRLTPSMVFSVAGQGEIVKIRDSTIPLYRLDRLLGVPAAETQGTSSLMVVIETRSRRIGIVVDDVIAQQQVVIKGLGEGLPGTRYLSGSAILSDGRVGLILNPDGIAGLADRAMLRSRKTLAKPASEACSLEPALSAAAKETA